MWTNKKPIHLDVAKIKFIVFVILLKAYPLFFK